MIHDAKVEVTCDFRSCRESIDIEAWNYHGTTAVPLTEAFRRARLMAGERPGLVLEEVPILSQVPLVFLEARHG